MSTAEHPPRAARTLWAILLVILFIVIGGVREIIFVNINEQIEYNAGRRAAYYVLPYLDFLGRYSISTLSQLKWGLTILTMLLNFSLSILAIRTVLRRSEAVRWLIGLYVIGFIVSGLSYLIGRLVGQPEAGYTLARVIMGGLQSPFPLMMLIPALYLMPESSRSVGGQ